MPGNPATAAANIFRIPASENGNGVRGGLLFYIDEANNKIQILDEESNYEVVELPPIVEVSNTIWLDKDNGIGIKLNGSTIEIYFNNLMIYELKQTEFTAYYDVSPQLHFNIQTGDLYIAGQLHTDNIDMP